MKTYHFFIEKDHILIKARTYENALKRAKKYKKVVNYIGYSNGTFGTLYFNQK